MGFDHPAATKVALPAAPDGWHDQWAQVLDDGTLAIMRCERDIWAKGHPWHSGLVSGFWRPPSDKVELAIFNGDRESPGPSLSLVDFPIFDRLECGEWLVVGSRTYPERTNGRIYTADGTLKRSFHAGDGVADVMSAGDGSFWVSYFDEGIFGGDQLPDGSWPIASSGLARIGPDGQPQWRFNDRLPFAHVISDCYAMTTTGGDLWTCYYTDFPIARVRDGAITFWRNAHAGAQAIAVEGEYVLLAGGYRDMENRVVLLRLTEDAAVEVARFAMTEPDRGRFHFLGGREGVLHMVGQGDWHSLRVADCIP